MPVLFAMQNRFDSTEVSQRAVFRQHVSGKMKGGECNGRTGKGRKNEVACLLSQNVSIESTENERQIVTLKEIEGQFSCSNVIFWNMNQTEGHSNRGILSKAVGSNLDCSPVLIPF